MESSSTESRIILAIQALKKDPKLKVRKAATLYNVPEATLRHRRAGRAPRRETRANSMKLTKLEETVILERIIDLVNRGFPPRLDDVRDMANRLLAVRDATRVGPRWAGNFIQRQPDLLMRFQRRIDYQRALAEDPEIIESWFALVRNVIAKYGILDMDIYNFDETGFLMGMLSHAKVVTTSDRRGRPRTKQPGNREWVSVIQGVCADGWAIPPYIIVKGKYHLLSWYTNGQFPPEWRVHPSENGWTTNEIGLDWLQHFENCTKDRTRAGFRLLILDGHNSHKSTEFDDYCKEKNIIALCMPPHSSHELQPLDVGCFSPLKVAYGKEIEKMMRMQITHITKDDFFPAFKAAFFASMGEQNVQAGFRQAGIVPLDPQVVISRLDFKPKTPSPPMSRPGSQGSWDLKTPTTALEAVRSSTSLKKRIKSHQDSSPTTLYKVVDLQAKGISKLAHKLAILEDENRDLRMANEILSKRRRARKAQLQLGGSLNAAEAEAIQVQRGIVDASEGNPYHKRAQIEAAKPRARCCGNCGETGHNARTCQVVSETSEEEDLEHL